MKTYAVKLPISGVAYLEIEAETEREAIDKAFEEVTLDHVEEWEALEQINRGNTCYAMQPWEAEAELIDEGDENAIKP